MKPVETLKVCMVVQAYYLRDPRVIREAEAIVSAGGRVDVICIRDKGEPWQETVRKVQIYRIPPSRKRASVARYLFEYSAFFLLSTFRLISLHARHKYDVIQVHSMPDFLVFAAIIPKLLGCKVILDIHEPMPEMFMCKYRLGKPSAVLRLLKLQERLSLGFADHVLVVHHPLQEVLIKRWGLHQNMSVLLNTPDEGVFGETLNQRMPNASMKSFTLVYAGTVAKRYNLAFAIRGVDLLKETIPSIRLMIVGEGEDIPRLKRMVKTRGLQRFVEFLPPVPHHQVPSILAAASAGISTHEKDCYWDLYFSTKIVECLRMGIPVVSARTKTISYYFDDETLSFFDPGDIEGFVERIRLLYDNPALGAQQVARAQSVMPNLAWQQQRQLYLSVLSRLAM